MFSADTLSGIALYIFAGFWVLSNIEYYLQIGAVVIAADVAIYAGVYWLRNRRWPKLKRPAFNWRTVTVGLLLLVIELPLVVFSADQQGYINESHNSPAYYPCHRILCLDNYFPLPAGSVDTSQIKFTVLLPTSTLRGYKLKFVDTSTPNSTSAELTEGQPYLSLGYMSGEGAYEIIETADSPAIENGSITPTTVVDGTAVFSPDAGEELQGSSNSDPYDGIIKSLRPTPLANVPLRAYGR